MRVLSLLLFVSVTPSLLAEDEASIRLANIQAEIEMLGEHSWAGKYCDLMQGIDTGPSYVWLAPKYGAAYHCEGWISESDFGSVSVDESVVTIQWENPNRTGRSPTERELIVVRFRGSIYLVPKTQIHAFCLAVRGKGERPIGLFRRDNSAFDSIQADEVLQLPPQFTPYVDLPPIVTKVTKADDQTRNRIDEDDWVVRQLVTIDVGAEHHVFPGMRFQRKDKDFPFPMIEVKAVRDSDSDAELQYYVKPNKRIRKIGVGDTYVTTRW